MKYILVTATAALAGCGIEQREDVERHARTTSHTTAQESVPPEELAVSPGSSQVSGTVAKDNSYDSAAQTALPLSPRYRCEFLHDRPSELWIPAKSGYYPELMLGGFQFYSIYTHQYFFRYDVTEKGATESFYIATWANPSYCTVRPNEFLRYNAALYAGPNSVPGQTISWWVRMYESPGDLFWLCSASFSVHLY